MGQIMEKYSVLLVDDEEEVIQVIMKKIDWNALGFAVIGSASNGVRALEMAEKYQPDVVMTDIKMPYMDGLELARRLKKEMPTVRILLFTGFDEFEYAKEAVHLEVEEYILKPVNSQELTEVFGRLKKTLDQDREEKRSVEKLQTYYEESLPLLQANFFSSLGLTFRVPGTAFRCSTPPPTTCRRTSHRFFCPCRCRSRCRSASGRSGGESSSRTLATP